jgi:hypothetical protein
LVIQITVNPDDVDASGPGSEGILMTEPIARRDRNSDATRRDILAAGREIFYQQPYSEVSGL